MSDSGYMVKTPCWSVGMPAGLVVC